MSDLAEAQIALAALLAAAPGIPVCVSLTFEQRKRGFFTVMGNRLEERCRRSPPPARPPSAQLHAHQRRLPGARRRGASRLDGPLFLQPNAGQPRLEAGCASTIQTPEEFAADLAGIAASQASAKVETRAAQTSRSAAAAAPIRASLPPRGGIAERGLR
jgi:hypothetical protein